MIYELNIKNENDGQERYYGIHFNPPVNNIKEALHKTKYEKLSQGVNYAVGFWVNAGCYEGGQYIPLENYERI